MKIYENLVDLENSKLLQNDDLVAIVAVHTAENEPLKILRLFQSFFNVVSLPAIFPTLLTDHIQKHNASQIRPIS